MGALSREKGKSGEREAATLLHELTGHHVARRVRQHAGDSDLEGLPGWAIEVKRYATVTPALIRQWWEQAATQADKAGLLPVLFYRPDRGPWVAMWPAALHCQPVPDPLPCLSCDTLSATPHIWWQLCSAIQPPWGVGAVKVLPRG